MSFDPTEWAKPSPEQQPVSQPAYGQVPQQPTTPPAYGQVPQQPAYGQSSPSLPPLQPYGQGVPSSPAYPPYGQPAPQQPVDPYAAPASTPGQPYQPGPQSWGAAMPSAYTPPTPPKKRSGAKIALIIVILLVVLGGGGGGAFYAYYVAHLPKPVISMTSNYKVGTAFAGATDTKFQLTGHDFSASSTVTFLLDGALAPGSTPVQSASDGSITATLTVTDGWSVGSHTITAKDAAGYATKVGSAVTIVVQGQAGTPGPNGAPTDSASGTIDATIQSGGQSEAATLNVTGSPDGGKVCNTVANGQPRVRRGTSNGLTYTETKVLTCSGTYKGGKLSYTETTTKDKFVFSNGVVCTAATPYVNGRLEGSFTSATSITGSFSSDSTSLTCTLNGASQTTSIPAQTGTWTGNASMQ